MSRLWTHPGHLLLILAAYLPFLGRMSIPLTGDQKLYVSTAMEMRQDGSWLIPIFWNEPSYFKPPFQYWMTMLGWEALGFNLWGTLIMSVMAVLGTAWFLGEIVRLLQLPKSFVNAGLAFAASLGTMTYGTTAQMEIWVCFFYAASWWAGLRYLADPIDGRHRRWLYIAFGVAGLAALVKSPLYSVFWVSGYILYLLISGEWEVFRERHFYGAWVTGTLLGAAWYVAILFLDGERFWADYVLRENLEKGGGNGGAWWSLWMALLYFFLPFTLLLFPSLNAVARSRRTGRVVQFALSWALPPAIFFTLHPYRIKPYLYILVPLAAILVDWGYYRAGRTRLFRMATVSTGILVLAACLLAAVIVYRSELAGLPVIFSFLIVGAAALFLALTDRVRGLVISGLGLMLLIRVTAGMIGEEDIAGLRMAKALEPEAAVAVLSEDHGIWHDAGLLSVALGQPIVRHDSLEPLIEILRSDGMVILSDVQAQEHLRSIEARLLGVGELRSLQETPWLRWKSRTKFPYLELLRGGRAGVENFEERMKRPFLILKLN